MRLEVSLDMQIIFPNQLRKIKLNPCGVVIQIEAMLHITTGLSTMSALVNFLTNCFPQ